MRVTRRRIQAFGMAALMAVGGAYAIASWDWCGRWEATPAQLVSHARGTGLLHAGAAAVELDPPWPVTVAGYGPMRPEASRAARPLKARALVLQAGALTTAIVSIDLLLVPQPIVDEVREKSGLPHAWVVATHAHSSMGGYDARPLAELAGTGWYRASAKNAIVRAAVDALKQAQAALVPAAVWVGEADAALCRPRTGESCDGRLTRVAFTAAAGGAPIAESIVLAAHPTLVARKTEVADPDYPGALAESRDAGVTFVLQGAGGNASASGAGAGPFAEAIAAKLPEGVAVEGELAVARATVALPHPDASRLVPRLSRVPATNFVCLDAARTAEVSVLRFGPLVWVAVPVEASQAAGAALETAAGATRLVSLANGYVGYLEPAAVVEAAGGESKRQYYGPGLAESLMEAAALAGKAVR